MRSSRRSLVAAAVLLVVAVPTTARAQVFLASRAHPDFAIGPLFVTASVRPEAVRVESCAAESIPFARPEMMVTP